uniref:NADH dehydrogenase subunit 3 n=1 Tax=Clogmia albipunctata TaxID=85120 RepID=UPI001EDDA1C7|nr:NADH dehydrogenase subunit 3 [Clogmia albipunctata]UHY38876.1 NADH dehydrogenase subunit 3 [Clogmia albipunctata]
MFMLFTILTIIVILCFILFIISFLVSKKMNFDREKSSPFECGFDPKSSSRIPFSLQFFLIAVIFLIFDVEIALILPMIITIKVSNIMNWMLTSLIFLLILLIGLFHEWNQGALNWSI